MPSGLFMVRYSVNFFSEIEIMPVLGLLKRTEKFEF